MPKVITESKRKNPTRETKRRVREVIDKIRKSWQKDEIYAWLQETYDVSERTCYDYYHDAQKILQENLPEPELVDQIRNEQIARITLIMKTSMEKGDNKSALKAADMLNKIAALYTEKQDINITSDVIRFEFDTLDRAENKENE